MIAGPKTALVTGSSVRTGRRIAQRLAQDGYHVIVHGKEGAQDLAEETVRLCREAGSTAQISLADLGNEQGCRKLSESFSGPLHLLVHNVGIYRTGGLLEINTSDWHDTLRTNLDAPFHLTRLLVDRMPPGSSIIALGYVGTGKLAGTTRTGAYSVSKTGLLVLVRSLAMELGRRGIRVNMVSPGQLENSVDLPADIAERVPLGRSGREEEVAEAVSWLASEKASYITGQELEIAGGLMLGLKGQ
ncbi:MAG: SDR family oxidoreductase [Fibrobacterota bacterium]|nr:SDR family oxidoreductase [Fibrobacterota bacterium]QQS04519.1 MAG: SDR family oxidoreductase [Fibrobacterota bacterium]